MTDHRYVTGEDYRPGEERFHIIRLCECAVCHGSGKTTIAEEVDGEIIFGYGVRCPNCRGEGRTRELVATSTDERAVGVALVTLARDGEFEECPIGLLDTQGETGKKWLIRPWLPSARNISDAGRTLAKSKTKGKT
jgi:hypothetical protein